MPSLRKEVTPIAILISDLHLSLTAPACRAETDWLEVQARYLKQVSDAAKKWDALVLCAGDVFDKWCPPPELINFALDHLPDGMLSIPGQHDLPNHRIADKHRSGYGVLAKAGKIRDLSQRGEYTSNNLVVLGFGWEEPIVDPERMLDESLYVALIHRYCWKDGWNKYPGASEETNFTNYVRKLKDYDVAVFGDNHMGFLAKGRGGATVLNCGGFIRRKSDEIDYIPCMGLLYADGTVKREPLDISEDRFDISKKIEGDSNVDMSEFLDTLKDLGEQGLCFSEAVENFLREEELDPEVKKFVLRAISSEVPR